MWTAKTRIRLGGCPADLNLRWAHSHFVGFADSEDSDQTGQASLSLTWSETLEDTFSHDEAHF